MLMSEPSTTPGQVDHVVGRLRSDSNLSEMEQKDHILRLARGASRLDVSLAEFTQRLAMYVDDESEIDRQPLVGWWSVGGA